MEENIRCSLCMVSRDNWKKELQLRRLADIQDGRLVAPEQPPEGEKWSMLYWDTLKKFTGPTDDVIGLWEWYASPQYRDPTKFFIHTDFLAEERPVLLLPVETSDPQEACAIAMESGLVIDPVEFDSFDFLFACREAESDSWLGAFCSARDCISQDGRLYCKNDVNIFPVYSLQDSDVFYVDNRGIVLPRQLETPIQSVSVGDADHIIESCLLDALTWPYFREHTGGSQEEWRTCTDLIQALFRDPVSVRVAKRLNLSRSDADRLISVWAETAATVAEYGTEDARLMAAIAMGNEHIRTECINLAEDIWAADHEDRVQSAEQEIQTLTDSISRLKAQEKSTTKTLEGVKKKTSDARKTLKELNAQIQEKSLQADNTGLAVQNRIEQARQDMASFVGDLNSYLPALQSTLQIPASPAVPEAQRSSAPLLYTASAARPLPHAENAVQELEDWQDELDVVLQNLKTIVPSQFRLPVGAYLYSAYLCNVPVLAAGPCGQQLADALSAAVCGTGSGCLQLEENRLSEASEALIRSQDRVVSIRDPFRPDATARTPWIPEDSDRFLMWIQPLSESLAGAPAGLFCYMLPLLTEPLLNGRRIPEFALGKRRPDFQALTPRTDTLLLGKSFRQLNLSGFLLGQLNQVLSTASAMLSGKAADIELLCGLLPLSMALKRQDVLRGVLDMKGDFSSYTVAAVRSCLDPRVVKK